MIAIFLALVSETDLSENELSELVYARIEERERLFVESLAPTVREMALDFGMFDQIDTWAPKTLEEFLAPLTSMITVVEGQPPNKPEGGNGVEAAGESDHD